MMEKYFDNSTQEMMYEWVVNALYDYADVEASSATYKVMATRRQIESILRSFGNNENRRGCEVYNENFSFTKDGGIYNYTVEFKNNGRNWIDVTAYLVEKMNVFYEKDFVGGEQ